METEKSSNKQKEIISYAFWGGISAVLNIGLFQFLVCLGMDYRISNGITLMANRIFCYMTNKLFVFHSKCNNIVELLKEMGSFFCSRIITFFLDYIGVIILVQFIGMVTFWSKIFLAGIVILINYVLSRKVVFRKTDG